MKMFKFFVFLFLVTVSTEAYAMRAAYRFLEPYFRQDGKRIVFQEEVGVITCAPGQKPISLFTKGLVGCMATTLCVKDKANVKRAFLTHYHHKSMEHLRTLREQAQQLRAETKEFDGAYFVVILPSYDRFTHADNIQHDADCQEMYDAAKKIVHEAFHPHPVEVARVNYSIPIPGKSYAATSVDVSLSNDEPSYCHVEDFGLNSGMFEFE